MAEPLTLTTGQLKALTTEQLITLGRLLDAELDRRRKELSALERPNGTHRPH